MRGTSECYWEKWANVKGRQPSCRNCHTATLFQSYMVIFGGKEGDGRKRLVNDLHILDLERKEWLPTMEPSSPGPDPRMGHSALLVGSRILIYGGWNGTRVLFDCYQLELAAGVANPTWSELHTYGEAPRRQFHTANCINKRMLVFGGGDGKSWLNDLYSLDLQTNEWVKISTIGPSPAGRLQHISIGVGNLLYVFGGEPGRQRQLNDMHVLDTTTWEWSSPTLPGGETQPPSPRVSTTSCTVGKVIFFFGGYDGNQWLNDVHSFDTEKSPDARCRHTATYYKGKLITFGGNDCDRSFNDLHSLTFPQDIGQDAPQLPKHLAEMLAQGLFADVTFVVEESRIPAHRCVLACRSEHFRAMFMSGMMESSARDVAVIDISPKVFRAVLTYIYTETVDVTDDLSADLFIAANRFCLQPLKSLCEKHLAEMISLKNIVDLLVLAKRHQGEYLMKQGIEFATDNLEAVRRLPDLNRLSKSIMLQLLKEGGR